MICSNFLLRKDGIAFLDPGIYIYMYIIFFFEQMYGVSFHNNEIIISRMVWVFVIEETLGFVLDLKMKSLKVYSGLVETFLVACFNFSLEVTPRKRRVILMRRLSN